MKKLFLSILVLGLLLSGNAYANTMNQWIAKGYQLKNEDMITDPNFRSTKFFTLMNSKGFIVICTLAINRTGAIQAGSCEEQ